jgi:hypothetical protein
MKQVQASEAPQSLPLVPLVLAAEAEVLEAMEEMGELLIFQLLEEEEL